MRMRYILALRDRVALRGDLEFMRWLDRPFGFGINRTFHILIFGLVDGCEQVEVVFPVLLLSV